MRHQNKFTNLSREKRRLERIFRKSHPTVHRQLFMEACSRYNSMLDSVTSQIISKPKLSKQATTGYLKLLIDCSPQDHRFYQLSLILWIPCLKI